MIILMQFYPPADHLYINLNCRLLVLLPYSALELTYRYDNKTKILTSLISLCCCCKLCTVGCAADGIVMAGLNVGLGCGLGTDTGVLPTGGCCFFLKESCQTKS